MNVWNLRKINILSFNLVKSFEKCTCCGAALLFESETDTPAVCDVDGCAIVRAESSAEKKLVPRNDVDCLLLLAPDEPAKL